MIGHSIVNTYCNKANVSVPSTTQEFLHLIPNSKEGSSVCITTFSDDGKKYYCVDLVEKSGEVHGQDGPYDCLAKAFITAAWRMGSAYPDDFHID